MTATQLAKHLHLTTASTTHLIKRLVARHHITQTPNPDDRRSTLVAVTTTTRRKILAGNRRARELASSHLNRLDAGSARQIVDFLDAVTPVVDSTG